MFARLSKTLAVRKTVLILAILAVACTDVMLIRAPHVGGGVFPLLSGR